MSKSALGKIHGTKLEKAAGSARTALPITTLVLLMGALALGLFPPARPVSAGLDEPTTDFSSARARTHVVRLAVAPRLSGTTDHAKARDYIVAELKKAGLNPQVQQTTAARIDSRGWAAAGNVQNVIARVSGVRGRRAILLSAHYDSVASSPGAADDASGVAVLLETARAQSVGARLANDLIFLFTDGEESGLTGAEAFASQHEWARDVSVSLNFEARGSGGAAYLFETSSPNNRLINELSRASTYPAASSLFYEIYRLLPNDSDLTVFRKAGFSGMNFAFMDKVLNYHASEDTEPHLDGRSLQQMGLYAQSMVRALGNSDLSSSGGFDVVYFSVARSALWVYPTSWALPLSVAGAAAWAAAVVIAFGRRRVAAGAVVVGILVVPIIAAAAGGAAVALFAAVYAVRPDFQSFLMGDIYHHWAFLMAALCLSAAIGMFTLEWLLRRWSLLGMWLGCLLWASAAHVAIAVLLPGASYLIAWPHLAAAAGALFLAGSGVPFWAAPVENATARLSRWGILVALVSSAVWAVFPVVLFRLLPPALGLAAGMPIAILLALLACWQIPAVAQLPRLRAVTFLGGTVVVIGVLLAVGFLQNRYSPQQPLQAALFYGVDADRSQAWWAARGRVVRHSWLQTHFGAHPTWGPLPAFSIGPARFTSALAPLIPLAAPEAEVTVVAPSSSGRERWTIRLRSMRGAPSVMLRVAQGGPSVKLLSVNGHGVSGSVNTDLRGLVLRGAAAQGDDIVVDFPAGAPLAFQLLDWTPGLPGVLGPASTARPPDITLGPEFDLYNWSTVISKEFRPIPRT